MKKLKALFLKSEIIKKKIVFTEYLTDAQKQLKSSQNLTFQGKLY